MIIINKKHMTSENPFNVIEAEFQSNIKFKGDHYQSVKIDRMVVKESDIPLQILFNDQVNKIKQEDKKREHNVRPLVFTY